MSKPIVYLAGGIAGLSGRETVLWREEAQLMFDTYGIETLSPMRGKEKILKFDTISRNSAAYSDFGPFYTSRGIMSRDFNDVKQADALLVNLLGLKQPSVGTAMEMAWAYALQKPTVVVMEASGSVHDGHPMFHEATSFRVDNLEEGCHVIAVVLGR